MNASLRAVDTAGTVHGAPNTRDGPSRHGRAGRGEPRRGAVRSRRGAENMDPPLFGLRWVPDAQLRPLRYVPASAVDPHSICSAADRGVDSALGVASLAPTAAALEEAVHSKSAQISWLKDVARGDARRLAAGPRPPKSLQRVFHAWYRYVRTVVREALMACRAEVMAGERHMMQLQADCDRMRAEQAVMQVALNSVFAKARHHALRLAFRAAFRRWRATVLGFAISRQNVAILLRGRHLLRAMRALRLHARRARDALAPAWFTRDQRSRLRLRHCMRVLGRHGQLAALSRRAARALRRMEARAALRALDAWRAAGATRSAVGALGAARCHRAAVRAAWRAWSLAHLRTSLARSRDAAAMLQSMGSAAETAHEEALRLRAMNAVDGDVDVPEILAFLREAASAAAAPAAAAGPHGAAVDQLAWQGQQLYLCTAALDSLRRQLVHERAASACSRDEARCSEAIAAAALAQLDSARGDEGALRARLADLEREVATARRRAAA